MRLVELKPEELSERQKAVYEESASGTRGHVPTPLKAWIRSPEMGARAQKLGEFVRYHTSLGQALSEMIILVTARAWSAEYEWYAHKKEALKAGLDPAIIDAIATRQPPPITDPKMKAGYDYIHALQTEHLVSDAVHAAAVAALGHEGIVELIGVSGYYTMVAMTLNAYQIPTPPGHKPELL
jgi:4-carboxymuconolactone decarboxylase